MYKRAIKAAQMEAANRHISMWAWKGAGYTSEGSAGPISNRADVLQGTVCTDCSSYPWHSITMLEGGQGHPGLGPRDRLVPLMELGLTEVLSLPMGAGSVNRVRSCRKRRADGTASRDM